MSRSNKMGRSINGPPFVRVPNPVYDSLAFGSLPPACVAVLLAVVRRYNGKNNGYIGLAVRDAAEAVNINKDTAGQAFHTLMDLGFIEQAAKGAFSLKIQHASEWRLTWEQCDRTGRRPSHAYRTAAPLPKRIRRSGNSPSSVP
ncbi:hypothetical protein [Brevundimonas sp. TWP2-3-4b1]|uniref:hypothetical protein n=1 Tax=Brevundimonas sp. TWP2-3-4b1 TaxID=2804580 RepID=UPI003CF8657E